MKGQFFLLFSLIIIILIYPILTFERRENNYTFENFESHFKILPHILNQISNSSDVTLNLRDYLELEREIFKERLFNFKSFIFLAIPNNDKLNAYVANYMQDGNLTLKINSEEITSNLRNYEIKEFNFTRNSVYNVTLIFNNLNTSIFTRDKIFYIADFDLKRGNDRIRILKKG